MLFIVCTACGKNSYDFDKVMARNLSSEKPLSITNADNVVEIKYDKAVIQWKLGSDASQVRVVKK